MTSRQRAAQAGLRPTQGQVFVLGLTAGIPVAGANTALGVLATLALVVRLADTPSLPKPVRWARPIWVVVFASVLVSNWLNKTLDVQAVTFAFGICSLLAVARLAFLIASRTSHDRLPQLLAGAAVGFLINALFSGVLDTENPWKYGVGFAVISAALCGFRQQTRDSIVILVLATFFLACILLTSRNLAATVIVMLAMIAVHRIRASGGRYTIALILIAAGLVFHNQVVQTAAESSVAQSVEDRFVAFERFNPNPLLAARIEIPLSLAAIQLHPIVGFGVNTGPTTALIQEATKIARQLDYNVDRNMVGWWTQDGLIYTHSLVAQAWVAGGALAGLLVLSLAILAIRYSTQLLVAGDVRHLAATFVGLQLVWNFLFSPYGATILPVYSVGLGALLYYKFCLRSPNSRSAAT